jgi:putative salt-induced outer membrane protein
MIRPSRLAVLFTLVVAPPAFAQDAKPPVKHPYELVADFALASSQGNQRITTVSLGQRYSYQFPRWKLVQSVSILNGTANGVKNAELYQGAVRADFKMVDGLSNYVAVDALRNRPSGILTQINEGVGVSYKLLRSDTDKMQISAGLGALQRAFVEGEDEQSFVGNFGVEYRHTFSPKAYVEQVASYTPDFNNTVSWLFASKTSLIAPLSSHFGLKVGYLINYNHLPPLLPPKTGVPPGGRFKQFDGLLTTGIQFTY